MFLWCFFLQSPFLKESDEMRGKRLRLKQENRKKQLDNESADERTDRLAKMAEHRKTMLENATPEEELKRKESQIQRKR